MSLTNPTNPVNQADKNYKRSSNTFDLSYDHTTTNRYSDIDSFFVMEGVERDEIPLRVQHEIRTPTPMQSPVLSNIAMNKDFFLVNMRAIMPKNWELIYEQPTQGDDVPASVHPTTTYLGVFGRAFIDITRGNVEQWLTTSQENIPKEFLRTWLRLLFLAESVYSNGSLFSKMGIHLAPYFRYFYDYEPADTLDGGSYDVRYHRSIDWFIDTEVLPLVQDLDPLIQVNGKTYCIDHEDTPHNADYYVSYHYLFELMREHMDFNILAVSDVSVSRIIAFHHTIRMADSVLGTYGTGPEINVSRLIGYQLICAHFYVNSNVDSIYTTELYLDMIKSLYLQSKSSSGSGVAFPTYSYNGRRRDYDVFSNNIIDEMARRIYDKAAQSIGYTFDSEDDKRYTAAIGYFQNLFWIRKSLRFGDYFTGARPNPLAVGDVKAPVVGNGVDAIDMTTNLLFARFLNAVNRTRRDFKSYVREIMGTQPQASPYEPMFISHSVAGISGSEIENTAESLGNIATIVKTFGSDYEFTVNINEPCIVYGLCSYTVKRIYSKTVDRQAYHVTRHDMFNPFMQYSGDQGISNKELDSAALAPDDNYAYTLRHMEYKQRISHASGGLIEYLKTWKFITDAEQAGTGNGEPQHISSEYIRAIATELNRFFSGVSNVSLAGWTHFVCDWQNECKATRAMEYAPSIL